MRLTNPYTCLIVLAIASTPALCVAAAALLGQGRARAAAAGHVLSPWCFELPFVLFLFAGRFK